MYLANQTVQMGLGEDGSDEIRRAVKTLRGNPSEEDRNEFVHESEVCACVLFYTMPSHGTVLTDILTTNPDHA